MDIFILYPWLALLIAAGFGALWFARRGRSAAIAGILWAFYFIYESLMQARVLCSGECNIRVDLLLLYPLLLVVSVLALVGSLRRR
jgi:hypothetical protein